MNQLINIYSWIVIAGSIGYWLYCFGKHIYKVYIKQEFTIRNARTGKQVKVTKKLDRDQMRQLIEVMYESSSRDLQNVNTNQDG